MKPSSKFQMRLVMVPVEVSVKFAISGGVTHVDEDTVHGKKDHLQTTIDIV